MNESSYWYPNIRPLRIDTADYRVFFDPYGPYHSKAIGKLYSFEHLPYDFITKTRETYFSKVTPMLMEGQMIPVKYVSRYETTITVRADFSRNHHWHDQYGIDGKEFILTIWGSNES